MQNKEISKCVSKRCLIRFEKDSWDKSIVVEVGIVELSPSKKWIKLYYEDSNNYSWRPINDVILVEELSLLSPGFKEVGVEDL